MQDDTRPPTSKLAQAIRGLSFDTWLANHAEDHGARWCRELYPWEAFAVVDYGDASLGRTQVTGRYELQVLDKSPGKKAGRTEFRVHLRTRARSKGARWRHGDWDDRFVVVAANDGFFITLFTESADPHRNSLIDFMEGRFEHLTRARSLPLSGLLFRTLVAELAEPLGPFDGLVPSNGGFPPFRARGNELWVMHGFTEEKAHRTALKNEGRPERLVVPYCQPTLSKHHRARNAGTWVPSLLELAAGGNAQAGRRYLPQIRFLTNHLHLTENQAAGGDDLRSAREALAAARGPMAIQTSELREARAAIGMTVSTRGEAAYALAAANLLNAASNARAGVYSGSQKIPKAMYRFKEQVARWIEGLVAQSVEGVEVFVDRGGLVYARVDQVQFSFHAIPRTPALKEYAASERNVPQEWAGRRLQAIAPAVLRWGRAEYLAEARESGMC
ncbi:MAG: hypothetical protein JJ863_38595 [Deltaproteobacteria bacterium]|nr:hypothetical protein [Deltaproteobacteria bacterium]